MAKVKLGKPDYSKQLTGELDASLDRIFVDWKRIAPKTGVCYNTARTYKNNPDKIPLLWLKRFIKAVDLDPDVILNYLYEGKYRVERR